MANQDDFQRVLDQIFRRHTEAGDTSVTVSAREVHEAAQDGAGNRYPDCCRVMRKNKHFGDRFIHEPPKGDGPSLEIEYRLPRRPN